jgi:hypothetical protein
MAPGAPAAAGGLRGRTAEFGEGCFVANTVRVVAGSDKELAREFGTYPQKLD